MVDGEFVELELAAAGLVTTRTGGRRHQFVDGRSGHLWRHVRRSGVFPVARCPCGSDLPQGTPIASGRHPQTAPNVLTQAPGAMPPSPPVDADTLECCPRVGDGSTNINPVAVTVGQVAGSAGFPPAVAAAWISASWAARQSMLTSRMSSTVEQRAVSSFGAQTITASAWARETATLSRLRLNRKLIPRLTSSSVEVAIEKNTTGACCPWNLSTVPTRAPSGSLDWRVRLEGACCEHDRCAPRGRDRGCRLECDVARLHALSRFEDLIEGGVEGGEQLRVGAEVG